MADTCPGIKEWRVDPLKRVSFSNARSFTTRKQEPVVEPTSQRFQGRWPQPFSVHRRPAQSRRRAATAEGRRAVRPDRWMSLWPRLNGLQCAESRPAGGHKSAHTTVPAGKSALLTTRHFTRTAEDRLDKLPAPDAHASRKLSPSQSAPSTARRHSTAGSVGDSHPGQCVLSLLNRLP